MPEALSARFEVQFNYDFDWKGAAATMRRALALAPSDPTLLGAASRVALIFGDRTRAIDLARQAVAVDPVNAEIRVYLGIALIQDRRWAEARAEFARIAGALVANPPPVVSMDGCSVRMLERVEAAVAAGETV